MDSQQLLFLGFTGAVSFVLAFYGSAVGLVLGQLRLPLLLAVLPPLPAMAANLTVSGLGALAGTYRHACSGRVSLRLLALMGLPSLAGALVGAQFLTRVDSSWVYLVVGLFLVVTGLSLASQRARADTAPVPLTRFRVCGEVLVGLALGFLSVLTGLMLGSLRLPLMIRLLRIEPTVAIATNMAIGCLTALFGAANLWRHAESMPLLPLLLIVPPTVLGGYVGARFTDSMRKETLQWLAGMAIAAIGLYMAGDGLLKGLGLRPEDLLTIASL